MKTATTVVSSVRYEQGQSYGDFLTGAAVNRDKFEHFYENTILTEGDRHFFRRASKLAEGPRRLLVIAEAWCGDVYRELPSAVHIAECAGMELRIFLRDENPDIMDEFLSNNGKSRAIPVFAFYTADTRYITHFTERSASAHVGLALAMNEARAQLNLPASASFGNLLNSERQVFFHEVVARVEPQTEQWRRDAVKEIRQLLAAALHLPDTAPHLEE